MTAVLEKTQREVGRVFFLSDTGILFTLALVRVLLQVFLNAEYGFHRDELTMMDAARSLAWGYVAYPPATPFLVHIGLGLFGPSLNGLRFFGVLAQGIQMLLVGLMVRDLGGSRWAQIVAAAAVGTSPISIIFGGFFIYEVFDFLCWILAAYSVVRLLKTEDPRWWLGIGAAIGLGAMTKYSMAFWVAGLVVGVLITRNRRYLKSPWLWGGVLLSLLIWSPNLAWQIQHHWISLDFLNSIHARDIYSGRADNFLLKQITSYAAPALLFFILGGLYYVFLSPNGKRYRLLGWMYVVTLGVLLLVRGLFYYLAPAYPMLIAAGAAWWEQHLHAMVAPWKRILQWTTWIVLGIGAGVVIANSLPIAPPGSDWWQVISKNNDQLREEIGWPELVQTVAEIYRSIPETEKPTTGILAGNGGEVGALNLYGPAYGLPKPISGVNSYWQDGYGTPPPQTLIVLGYFHDVLTKFESCQIAGHPSNPYNIANIETSYFYNIYVCRNLQQTWPDFWAKMQTFG